VAAAGLEDALSKAWEDARRLDLAEAAKLAGLPPLDPDGRAWVAMLGRNYSVDLAKGQVLEGGRDPARGPHELLVLHYITNAMGIEPTGTLISFRELRGGALYYAAFEGHTIKELVAAFGVSPDGLVGAAKSLGGSRAPVGHVGVTVPALPRIPVTVAVWRGDSEVPASANVLFDETIRRYLVTEDIVVLSELTVGGLVRRAALR